MSDVGERGEPACSVLIVDDNPENLRVLGSMLREQGYEVRVANDGVRALRSAEKSPPDIILLDIHMPRMDGYEVCRRLKADPRLRDVPVIFLSALNEAFNKVQAYDCGGADYVTKPFQLEEVRARMAVHLRTRRLLAESDVAFKSSFEQAAVGMAHLSTGGAILRVNSRLCHMLGHSEGGLLGLSLSDIADSGSAAVCAADLEALAAGGDDVVSEEGRYVRRDGDIIWCEATFSLVHVPSSNDQYVAAIFVDISERKRAEEELRDSEERYRSFLLDLPVGACRRSLDEDSRLLFANPALVKMLGYGSADELIANGPLAAHADPEQYRHFTDELMSRGAVEAHALRLARKDGTPFDARLWAHIRGTGKSACAESVIVDVTEQLSLEARLRQAQKMEAIGTLAGGIAHDFNNILSAIFAYTGLAMGDVEEGSDTHEYLSEVHKAASRAGDLVAQILAFSRKAERERQPFRLQSVVREALRLLRASIPSTVEIVEDVDAACGPVVADPTEVHQILMNLCSNAYHAMRDAGGVLTVRLSQTEVCQEDVKQDPELLPGSHVRLQIQDTGHGMSRETQARIFEPYFTTKERGEGTGLGLATVHGIVKDLGGSIHVYSEAGAGTVFSVMLPSAPAKEQTPAAEKPRAEELAGNERVLLVEDEEQIAQSSKTALERLGYRMVVEPNGEQALDLFCGDPDQFDIVITDQMMPRMKGTELAHRLMEIRPDMPIILCSGFGEAIREGRTDDGSIRDYVMKPIIATDLARAIRKVLGSGPNDQS